MRSWVTGLACVVSLLGVSEARATGPTKPVAALLVNQHIRLGQSVGSPTDGHLIGGTHLLEAPYVRVLPAYANDDAQWGLGSLVSLIDWSARAVRRQFPDAVLSVGHLSRRGGGDIDRHASHESGRDADLSFYIKNQTNHPLYSDHMVSFRGDGTAPSWPWAAFDDAKNWALVAGIVQEPFAHVTYIFVASPLRARLLAYAAHIGAPPAIRNRAAELMVQPHGSLPHDDHFHVRIGCPTGMTACIELPTRAKATRAIARHGAAGAHLIASNTAAPPTAGRTHATHSVAQAKSAAPVAPPAPASAPAAEPTVDVDATPAPTHSAVLVTPFDDVDGDSAPKLDPGRVDIQ